MVSMMAWLGFLFARPRGSFRRCCEVILIANLCLLSAVFIQYKGYHYHFYPPFASAMLLMGLLALESGGLDAVRIEARRRGLWGPPRDPDGAGHHRSGERDEAVEWNSDSPDSRLERMVRLARDHAKGGSIFTFSPALVNAFPLVTYSGVGWASRHPCLWFLPALYAEDSHKSALVYHPIETMSDDRAIPFRNGGR